MPKHSGPFSASLGHLLFADQEAPAEQQAQTKADSQAPRVAFVCPGSSAVSLVRQVVSPSECKALIQAAEGLGFTPPSQFKAQDRICERLHTVDTSLSGPMMARLRAFLPEELVVDGARWRLTRFTHHWRFVRYYSGGHFAPHYDGAKLLPWKEMSMFTVQIYLNSMGDDFTDGETRFFSDFVPQRHASHAIVDGTSRQGFPAGDELQPTGVVQPSVGDVLMFDHAGRSVFHDARPVSSGSKYILRGDVLYAAVPDDVPQLDELSPRTAPRTWCSQTAEEFGTRDFIGQVWTCDCAKDKHGSTACCGQWKSHLDDDSAASTAASEDNLSAIEGCVTKVVLISGKQASGKDFICSLLQQALEAQGLRVARRSLSSSSRKTPADIPTEDPFHRLSALWRKVNKLKEDVLLVTDFSRHFEHQFFREHCGSQGLALLRVEANQEARIRRGWVPEVARDVVGAEDELDSSVDWLACFDNSADGLALAEEWIERTALPRVRGAWAIDLGTADSSFQSLEALLSL